MKYTCKDCQDRKLGCHDVCDRYQSIKRQRHEDYERYIAAHNVCAEHDAYVIKQIQKQRRRTR